jgi:hypothetical protein
MTGVMLALCAGQARSQTLVSRRGDICVFDTDRFRVEVDSAGGARIRSWVLKPSGRQLIAMWKGGGEYGGALDDRATFTSARYRAAITEQGPEVGQVRFEVSDDASGLRLVKTITVRKASPTLEVSYQFENRSQQPRQLFIRNFFLPGHQPKTADHLYWVNADPSKGAQPVVARTDPGGYYPMSKPEYAALWDRATGDGILAFAPGCDRFYFWLQAAEYPTFEWIYANLAPGRRLEAAVAFIVVEGQRQQPDWPALIAAEARGVPQATVAPLADWQDDLARFRVTGAEKERGFWLSIGAGAHRRRLPDPLPLDLPLDGDRYLSVAINVLKDFAAPVRVEVPDEWRERIKASWETPSAQRIEVLGLPGESRAFAAGATQTLWLQISGSGKPAGEYRVPVRLKVGDAQATVNLGIHVWPVRVEAPQPFHVYGYSLGVAGIAGGSEVTERSLQRLDNILAAYADLGGDVFDWSGGWHGIAAHAKIAGTDESLADAAQRLDLNRLPHLDFSYYDPWFEIAKRRGVTMAQSYMSHPASPGWEADLFEVALGKGRVKAGTAEGNAVIAWFYAETKRYLEAKGFHGFFCKIQDEITPEEIPAYIETAKVVRMAGWRPFTTITGIVAHTAADINALNPYCDQWQLSNLVRDEFFAALAAKSPGAKPAAAIKANDEIWFYGGAENPFRDSYYNAWVYPQIATWGRYQGYAMWAFYWPPTEHLAWLDDATSRVTVSPPYLGFRDGWRDAQLFAQLIAQRGRPAFEEIVGRGEDASMRIGPTTLEVYRFTTIVNADDPLAINAARRRALQALATRHEG